MALFWGGLGAVGAWFILPPRPGEIIYVEAPPQPYRFYELGALTAPYFTHAGQTEIPFCPGPDLVYTFSPDRCTDLYGVDLSHHDGEIDFTALAASGVDFAHIRATHGVTIVDIQLQDFGQGMVALGIPFGTYHFFFSLSTLPRKPVII